ncbi:MAG: hypothetical protein ACR2NN_24645 [Bryobacteraceae bacterium]
MDHVDRDFEGLMAQYRESIGAPEASVNFMPRLWQKIEAKRTFALRFRRLTQLFVGAAAAICLLIAGVSTVMPGKPAVPLHGTYLDALAEAHPSEGLAAQGIVRGDSEEGIR